MKLRLRLFGRHDALLLAGLTIALLVIFARPLSLLLDAARTVEQTYGVALIPALVILTVVFIFHQQAKRQEMVVAAAAAAAEARQAQERASELEQLVAFSQALSHALDADTLREVIWGHLPAIIRNRPVWIVTRPGEHWQPLMGASGRNGADLETIAAWVVAEQAHARRAIGFEHDTYYCAPLRVGETVVGVLGVDGAERPLDDSSRRLLGAIAPLLAIAIKNAQLFADIRDNSLHDALTGCFNRTHALDVVESELRRARRSRLPLTVLMFDLDRFKAINDEHGHLGGDAVLAAVGAKLRELLRGSDVKARYGGEEFLVVLPDTPAAGALHVAEWVRREIETMPVLWRDARIPVTASFGVAEGAPGELDGEAVIARADAALYQAKNEGRNCVRVSPAVHSPISPIA